MGSITALFNFTIRQTLLNRKIWLTVLILAGPCALIILIRALAKPTFEGDDLWEMYHSLSQFLLLMGLVPLICMVHGTALTGTEVEARTIVYLITRRMRRATVFVVKFLATALVLVVLCDLGMVGLHLCALTGQEMPSVAAGASPQSVWNPTHDMTCYLLIIPAAVVSFLAVFSMFGLLTARPLSLSIFYLIVFEMILSNIPVGARVYSLMHHLRATMAGAIPHVVRLYEVPRELGEQLYPEDGTGLHVLFAIVLGALILSGVLMTLRELIPTKVSRE